VQGIRVSGRNTQGVKLMNLEPGDRIIDVARVQQEDDAPDDGLDPLEPLESDGED
jgi:DNA gyrase subunit A